MKTVYLFVSIFTWAFSYICPAQANDTLLSRIVLVGDAGALLNGHQPVTQAIKKNVPLDAKTVIIYLGDNIYKVGLPDDAYIGYQEARIVLDSQVAIVKNTPSR